jgi:hypothetical protein
LGCTSKITFGVFLFLFGVFEITSGEIPRNEKKKARTCAFFLIVNPVYGVSIQYRCPTFHYFLIYS